VATIVGVSVGVTSSKKEQSDESRYYSFGVELESSVGTQIYEDGTSENKALIWISKEDPLQMPVTSGYEELIDRFIVATFYFATNGKEWTRKNMHFLSKSSVCEWNDGTHGIFCDENGKVVKIILGNCGLSGTIPSDIGLLDDMWEFSVPNNSIGGTIPPSISLAKNLKQLDFSKQRDV
jgi:hypothetical protein